MEHIFPKTSNSEGIFYSDPIMVRLYEIKNGISEVILNRKAIAANAGECYSTVVDRVEKKFEFGS